MNSRQPGQNEIVVAEQPRQRGLGQWIQDPMGSVVASSAAVMGSFGLVLFGTWFIHLTLNQARLSLTTVYWVRYWGFWRK